MARPQDSFGAAITGCRREYIYPADLRYQRNLRGIIKLKYRIHGKRQHQ